eukprot:TRINITY_DN862_c0_g1_i1.p2 TRINITY_DN862_c0_g1~~TRINITY_DN862_c0_g1_i1.p2  ORF type:complete len:120 (-),score=20.75 TRINITY_DN862_c0_g1_i1:21-380(-)
MLVHFDIDGNGVKEWTLVELQGRVENREEGDTIDGLPLGQLTRTDGGEIELVVGNSKLVGAEVKLDKPFAVLVPNQDKQNAVRESDVVEKNDAHWSVVGIVKRKLLFKSRPQPIVVKNE